MHCCNKGDASLFVMVSFSTFCFKWKWMDGCAYSSETPYWIQLCNARSVFCCSEISVSLRTVARVERTMDVLFLSSCAIWGLICFLNEVGGVRCLLVYLLSATNQLCACHFFWDKGQELKDGGGHTLRRSAHT